MLKFRNSFVSVLIVFGLIFMSLIHVNAQNGEVGPQKNYNEPLLMAYYRTWRDEAMPHDSNSNLPDPNVTKMTDIPNEVDIVSVFHYVTPGTDEQGFWDTLRDEYIPELHSRGTRAVRTLDYSAVLKIQDETGKDGTTLTTDDYKVFAQKMIDTYMTPWNLDGLDIDMETELNQNQVTVLSGVFEQLSNILKIKEGSDKLLIYDTNKDNHDLFKKIAPHISYLFIQAYGRNPSSLDRTWDTYKSDISSTKVLFGISFYEEQDRTNWNDASGPFSEEAYLNSRAYQYAKWQPEGGEKGGMFVYAVDRDGKSYGDNTISETDFAWTRRIDQTIHEVHSEKNEAINVQHISKDGTVLLDEVINAKYGETIQIVSKVIDGYKALSQSVEYQVVKGEQKVVLLYEKIDENKEPEVVNPPVTPENPGGSEGSQQTPEDNNTNNNGNSLPQTGIGNDKSITLVATFSILLGIVMFCTKRTKKS